MKKVAIIGHFGFGLECLDGQTVKTKILADELEKQFGEGEITRYDTHGGAVATLRILWNVISALKNHENVVILPAHNGIKIIAPWLAFWNRFYRRKLHYAVVGGWLPDFLGDKPSLLKCLRGFDGVYVETSTMKRALEAIGFENAYLMPNCKNLPILSADELVYPEGEPYHLCTFSRVMKEKGVEDAVEAVKRVNEECGRTIFTLDIYGQVDGSQVEWFEGLKASFPDYVKYGGLVPFDKSVEVLKDYYALLFPTRFFTEGVPGTIIDGYAAGVPVISARWESYTDVVEDGITGLGYEFGSGEALTAILREIVSNPGLITSLKENAIRKAGEFTPSSALSVLINEINNTQ